MGGIVASNTTRKEHYQVIKVADRMFHSSQVLRMAKAPSEMDYYPSILKVPKSGS